MADTYWALVDVPVSSILLWSFDGCGESGPDEQELSLWAPVCGPENVMQFLLEVVRRYLRIL